MTEMKRSKQFNSRSTRMIMIILGIGLLALAAGAANAAMQSIQLNSAASFPVDI